MVRGRAYGRTRHFDAAERVDAYLTRIRVLDARARAPVCVRVRTNTPRTDGKRPSECYGQGCRVDPLSYGRGGEGGRKGEKITLEKYLERKKKEKSGRRKQRATHAASRLLSIAGRAHHFLLGHAAGGLRAPGRGVRAQD